MENDSTDNTTETAASTQVRTIKIVAVFMAVMLLSVLVGVSVIGVRVTDLFANTGTHWHAFRNDAQPKGEYLARIRGTLGYGGLIHNYKNYILRGENELEARIEQNFSELGILIDTYEGLGVSEEEIEYLYRLREVIDQYRLMYHISRQAIHNGKLPQEIDAMVRVDDTPATDALAALEDSWRKSWEIQTATIDNTTLGGLTAIQSIYFLVPLVLMMVALLLWFIVRLVREVGIRASTEAALAHHRDTLEQTVASRTIDLTRANIRLSSELTERRRAEDALKQSEERLRLIAETAPVPIFILRRLDNAVVFANKPFAELSGISPDEATSRECTEFCGTNDARANLMALVDREGEAHNHESWFKTAAGDMRQVMVSARPIELGGHDCILVALIDVTEERQSQAQMVQMTKLASLGEMATGIAHEINQPLNIIRLTSDGLIHALGKNNDISQERLSGDLQRIADQTVRAASIIDHLRTFGRSDKADNAPLPLADAINGTLDLIGEQMRLEGIETSVELPDDLPLVCGDPIRLEQALLNLTTNARHAIRARIREGIVEDGRITFKARHESDLVVLRIDDTGGGIPTGVLERIFEPFFTTKGVGDGTGLGLSITHGIISEMGGEITAENISGGARFTVSLPTVNTVEQDNEEARSA